MWADDIDMLPSILERALCGLTLMTLLGACATGTMTQGEGLDGDLAGESGDGESGDNLPNPDPTFDGVEDDGAPGTSGGVDAAEDEDDDSADDGDTGSLDDDDGAGSTSTSDDSTDPTTGDDGTESTGDPSGGESGGSTGEPVPSLDVSGWTIVQTDSARTFELPPGTVLQPGMKIVIGRASSVAGFSAYWGTTLGSDVLFFSGLDDFPVINGDETYRVEDESGAVIDGPTPPLALGENVQRNDGAMPGTDPAAWNVSLDPGLDATPGQVELDPTALPTLVISEVSDTVGNGAYVHEFVELTYTES